jgi:hypothetical protein
MMLVRIADGRANDDVEGAYTKHKGKEHFKMRG